MQRILDAALECYQREGIVQTSLDDVARAGGIGRTTLYRYVSSRDDLLDKVLQRDAEQQQQELAVVTRYHDDLAETLVDSLVYIVRGRRTRPVSVLLFAPGAEEALQRLDLSPASFEGMARAILDPLFEVSRERGVIAQDLSFETAAQWLARVIQSLLMHPGDFLEDERASSEFLELVLVPSLLQRR